MLCVDNLKHGLNTNPFSLPLCAFLDSNMIDLITSMDCRRDIRSETAEFGNLMVSQLYLKLLLLSCRYIICNLCYIFPSVYFF